MSGALKQAGLVVAAAFVLLAGVRPSNAFEEYKVYRGVLILEGKIVKGDYTKLRDFLANKSNFDKISGGVFLASPGGSITESMRIGYLVRNLRMTTSAPSGPSNGGRRFGESVITPRDLVDPKSNYGCASACFFIYIAGVDRHIGWAGRLGVHRPFELESEAKKLDVDQTFRRNWQVRTLVQKYLKDMDVPEKYVDLIYSVPSTELHWLTQTEVDTDFQGFIPEVVDWIGNSCNPKLKIEKTASIGERTSEINRCWTQVRGQLSDEAWKKVFSPR